MGELQQNIINSITRHYRKVGFLSDSSDGKLPLLLSGGVDSTLCGLVGQMMGLKPVCISYQRKDVYSRDCEQAEKTCKIMGWEFHKVVLPDEDPKEVFQKLTYEYGVAKKTELEVLYPFLFLIDKIEELGFKKIVCGFNPSPDNRKHAIWNKKNSTEFWQYILDNNITSSGSKKTVSVAKDRGITMCCPMQGEDYKTTIFGLSDADMNKPYNKSFYKDCFPTEFEEIGMMKVKNEPLQKGGSMTEFFEPIIHDKEINFKNYKTSDVTKCLTSLTKLHGTLDEKKIKKHQNSNDAHRLWISQNLRNYSDAKTEVDKITDYSGKIIKFRPYSMEEVHKASSKNLFNVVSTFAGGGGSSTGYKLAGGKILLVNEFVKEAVKTYQINYPDTPVDGSDIRTITKSNVDSISKKKKLESVVQWFGSYGITKGTLDILDGSPPCSTFSQAGKGNDKEKKDVIYSTVQMDGKKTQDDIDELIFDFVLMVEGILPKVMVLENVPEIATSDVFKKATEDLRQNYFVNHKVLKASHFGVAQKRRRLFLVGVRKDISARIGIHNDTGINDLYPRGSSYETSLKEALEGVILNPKEVNLTKRRCRASTSYEILKLIPTDPPENYRASYDHKAFKNLYFNTNRAAFHQPVNTVTQTGAQLKSFGGQYHPLENRTFTINELKRLTGLPDDFYLSGTFNEKAERMGRMVIPLLMKSLASSLYENVIKPTNE